MGEKGINRRNALDRMIKLIAVAAGLSSAELRALLGSQIQRVQDEKTIIMQKSASKFVKNLKVLIENSRDVFENEFGRVRPVRQVNVKQIVPELNRFLRVDQLQRDRFIDGIADPAMFCGKNFGASGEFLSGLIEGFICAGENSCTGQDVGGGSGCAGTNECNGQSCDGFVCAGNDCEGQTCGEFGYCEGNKQSIVSVAELDRFRTDPYIQMLFEKFNVTTSAQLAAQLKQMFTQQRQDLMKIRN